MEWSCEKANNEIKVFQCQGTYKLLEEPFCHVCSEINITTQECAWHKESYGFTRIYVMGKYVPPSREVEGDLLSSHILKLKNDKEYAIPLGKALALTVQHCHPELLKLKPKVIPVPLHKDEHRQRGYNQALELARVLGKCLDIPVWHVLKKTRSVSMRPLKREERREAVRGLYMIYEERKDWIKDKQILLIDDVVTTGFTVSECSDVLIKSGAEQVNVLALARTVL